MMPMLRLIQGLPRSGTTASIKPVMEDRILIKMATVTIMTPTGDSTATTRTRRSIRRPPRFGTTVSTRTVPVAPTTTRTAMATTSKRAVETTATTLERT